MNWRLLTWKEIAGFLLVIGLVVVFVAFLSYANFPTKLQAPPGFGPDWSCTYPGKGDPVCVKKAIPPN